MRIPDRARFPRRLADAGSAATVACLAIALACSDDPTSAESAERARAGARAQAATASALPPSLGVMAANTVGALELRLPLTDTVTSGVPAFEIKQKGGGIAGRFEITNPNSAAIALDGVNSGTGHALLAWNLGKGRSAVFITSNSTNTLPTIDVSTQSSGQSLLVKHNNATTTNPAVLVENRTLGPTADFRVLNAASNAPVLLATSTGLGPAGEFTATTNNTGVATLSVTTNGAGRAFVVNHKGFSGNMAVFMAKDVTKIRFDRTGKGFFNGGTQTGGADVAEAFAVEGSRRDYGPGDVLVISERSDRTMEKAAEPYSTRVAGVHATKPGVLLTEHAITESLADLVPLGVVGVIPTKVSAENGAIRRGDLLVTSSMQGHAMRGTDRGRMLGAVIGKALEAFPGPGTGTIRVLVNVQ
jgi:hypothetical protein